MRKLLFNPVTAFAAAIALFFGLKSWIGFPDDPLQGLGFLLAYAYGCNLLFLLWFLGSPFFGKARKMKDVKEDPFCYFIMSVPATLMNLFAFGALALILGGNPGVVTRLFATVIACAFVLQTLPLSASDAQEWVREKLRSIAPS